MSAIAAVALIALGARLWNFLVPQGNRATPINASTVAAALTHLSIPMPDIPDAKTPLFATPSINITPDGRIVVFAATGSAGFVGFQRRLDSSESTRFFESETLTLSPDGRWLAFVADKKLLKVPLSGGAPTPLCTVQNDVRGACRLDDGTLVLTLSSEGGLCRIRESGCEPAPLTTLDADADELSNRWPEALPGARGVLYLVKNNRMESFDQAEIWAHDLVSGARRRLVIGGTMPRYVPESPEAGILIFSRDDHLRAARPDLRSLSLIGVPIDVWKDVQIQPERGIARFAVAREAGTLLHLNADRSIDQMERPR